MRVKLKSTVKTTLWSLNAMPYDSFGVIVSSDKDDGKIVYKAHRAGSYPVEDTVSILGQNNGFSGSYKGLTESIKVRLLEPGEVIEIL